MNNLLHSKWLVRSPLSLSAINGEAIAVYEFVIDESDDEVFVSWAKYFREHYSLDEKLDDYRSGTGKTRKEYLLDLVFPDRTDHFGPATRSGDFAEILVADLLESKIGYWIPRTRYSQKLVRNESPKGTDIIGFKLANNARPPIYSPSDSLMAVEAKAQMSGSQPKAKLQEAVDHSSKDALRLAESLNAMKRRLIDQGKRDEANTVERFQDELDNPYIRKSGAVAVFCNSVFDSTEVENTDCSAHENLSELSLMVIRSSELMRFVHLLYEKAADEA